MLALGRFSVNPRRRRIVIVDYDPGWPARFEVERDRVQRALGASAYRI